MANRAGLVPLVRIAGTNPATCSDGNRSSRVLCYRDLSMELQQDRRRTSCVRHWIIASCFFFVCARMNPAFATQGDNPYDESLKEQFLKEAPGRWAEYAEKTKRLQGHVSFTAVPSDGHATKGTNIQKKGAGDRLSIASTVESVASKGKDKDTVFYVDGFNPKYFFSLKRTHASMPWTLTALAERQEAPPAALARLDRGADYPVNRLVYLENERLVDVVRQAEFRVIGCRRIQASEDDLVLVDFDYPHEDLRRNEVQGGSLVLDPRRYWCLRSYNVRVKVPTGGRGTVKFTVVKWRDTEGFPVLIASMLETDAIEDNIRYKNKREHNYDLSIPESLPPDSEL